MSTESEEKVRAKKWRTRTSKISALQEPVPLGVYIGFGASALLFVMLHFFNKWWWHESFIP